MSPEVISAAKAIISRRQQRDKWKSDKDDNDTGLESQVTEMKAAVEEMREQMRDMAKLFKNRMSN